MPSSQEIRQRIMAIDAPDHPLVPSSIDNSIKNHGIIIASLGICILFLSLATFGTIVIKQSKPISGEKNHLVSTRPEVETFFKNASERMSVTESKLEKLSNQVWLLGIAHNENTNQIAKQEWTRYGASSNYIVFDEDWKINRMPELMPLSEEIKKDLQKYVK